MYYELLDWFFHVVHLTIIFVNVFGWIFSRYIRVHLICVLTTAFSWFIMGIWYGLGYCFITDWQWQVKMKLGETNLPASYITFILQKMGIYQIPSNFIERATLIIFLLALIISLYLNFKAYKRET